jgi:hypothetical protein
VRGKKGKREGGRKREGEGGRGRKREEERGRGRGREREEEGGKGNVLRKIGVRKIKSELRKKLNKKTNTFHGSHQKI